MKINCIVSDILKEYAIGVKNKQYKKIPYDKWRELRSHGEDYGSIEMEFAFANPHAEDRTRIILKNQKGQEIYTPYITDGAFGTYLFHLYQKWCHKTTCDNMKATVKASCDKLKDSFNQLAATAYSTTADLTISSQTLKDYCISTAGTSGIAYDNNRKENDNMSNLIKGFQFGSCENDNVKMSIYGVAVKNAAGSWVSYDAKTESIIDVDVLNFDGGKYLYKMPVAINNVKKGDMIIHNRKPMFVTTNSEEDSRICAIDPAAGEEKIVLLTKSPFGFNFVTKVVNLFEGFANGASTNSPFGNMLPLMLMNDDNDSDNMLPLLFMMNNGNMDLTNNPMLLYFLMKDGKHNDMLPLMLLSNNGTMFGTQLNSETPNK